MNRLLAIPLLAVTAFGLVGAARAADVSYLPGKTTPDISVSGSTSANVAWDGGPVDYVYIKNDCSTAMYFSLRDKAGAAGATFPIRLAQNQTFEGPFRVNQVAVSPGATAGSTCTFTLMIGRH